MKRFLLALSLLIIFLTILFFFGLQRLVNVAISHLLSQINTGSIQLNFKTVNYSFPLNLRMTNVTLTNQDFQLTAPEVDIAFNWGLLVGKNGTIVASLSRAEVISSSSNLFQNMKDFRFQHFPDFEIVIQNLRFPKNNLFLSSIPVHLQKKENLLHFQIDHPTIFFSGTIVPDQRVEVDYRSRNTSPPMEGHLVFSFLDNAFTGTLHSKISLSFTTTLGLLEDEIEFQNLKIASLSESQPFKGFSGQGRLLIQPNLGIQLTGEIGGGTVQEPYRVKLELQPTDTHKLLGTVNVKSIKPDLDIHSNLLINPETSSFSLRLLPGSFFAKNLVNGEIKGTYSDQQLRMEFVTEPLEINISGLSGKGWLNGNVSYSSGILTANGQLNGDWIRFHDYQLNQPQVRFQFDQNKKVLFQVAGRLFNGELKLDGRYSKQEFMASGTLTDGQIDQFLGNNTLPLKGSFSGSLQIQKSKLNDPSLVMEIQDGSLSWKDFFLGNHLIGKLDYQGDRMSITNIMLQNGDGTIGGDIQKKSDIINGTLRFNQYPFFYRLADRTLRFSGNGSGEFRFAGGQWGAKAEITSPEWNFGEWSGTDFIFQGELSPESILIEKCETGFLGGNMSIHGKILPYDTIDLVGSLSDLDLPDNSYQLQGKIHRISLAANGPWNNVAFRIDGKGEGLVYQGQPLGESFEVVLEGESGLPQKNEKTGIERFLNPEILKKGIVNVHGAHLDQLGMKGIGDYTITGLADFEAQIDVAKKIWLIQSQDLTVEVGDLLNFTGTLQGSYQKDQIDIQHLLLSDETKNIHMKGSGHYNVKEKTIEGRLSGDYNASFPLPDFGVELWLAGTGELNIAGPIEKPQYGGRVQIDQGVVSQNGKDLVRLEQVIGTIKERELLITEGRGQWLGFDFTTEGLVGENGVNLTFIMSGKNGFKGPMENLQGDWKGKISIQGPFSNLRAQGAIQVKNGFINTALFDKTQSTTTVFQTLTESFQKIPLKLKLLLATDGIFRVKTRFLDLNLSGEITLDNTDGPFNIQGRLDVVDGTYDLVMRTIPMQGYVVFGDLFGFIPQVHLEGRTEVKRYEIVLRADGPLGDYEMILQSEPSLSQEEILSLLFVGDKDAYQSLETLDLEPHLLKALRFFLGMKGTGLNNILFFDSVELIVPNQENEGFYGLELKKDLGENASISYTHDLSGGENSTWNFELDLNREWSFKSDFGSNGKYGWELEFKTRF